MSNNRIIRIIGHAIVSTNQNLIQSRPDIVELDIVDFLDIVDILPLTNFLPYKTIRYSGILVGVIPDIVDKFSRNFQILCTKANNFGRNLSAETFSNFFLTFCQKIFWASNLFVNKNAIKSER